ncbi:MAG: fibronectin type III domain-containing protein [Bacteroidia bacterium]|nr:fibronectin type III domain-containing protein [Bacteroidia bacterium]
MDFTKFHILFIDPQMMKRITYFVILLLVLLGCQVDDESVIDQCLSPDTLTLIGVSSNAATITWSATNEISIFEIEYGLSGFAKGTGNVASTNINSIILSGLNPETSYDIYVQSKCSINNLSAWSEKFTFSTNIPLVVPQFRPLLSQLNIYTETLKDLNVSPLAFEYKLATPLFSDYSHKQRIIALPPGQSMISNGNGLPVFPNNTVIAKTFYYNNDERDLSQGKQILETRVLIKIDGEWQTGNYKWNEAQTDAILDYQGSEVPVSWIDENGSVNSLTYKIPSNTDCFTCHNTYNQITPIGPKLRSLNFDINGNNQLHQFINNQYITGVSVSSEISQLPDWTDVSLSTEIRARAYMDINCAHCHVPGGFCEDQSTLNLAYETSFEDSNIFSRKNSILYRTTNYNPGISMPLIGTSVLHGEGVDLIQEYLDSL